ncbi:MAG: hypothetical protein WAU25_03190 [Nitrososphaeraceae archaeon]|jgi:hypothetical protein
MGNSSPNRDKNDIGTGIGTRIVNLGSTNCLCDFNEDSRPSDWSILYFSICRLEG